ncbi:MAG: VWA domain-containing protein [Acidobacteriia bacterium]|nr:VWA domain-containing protein [Terriglobia bacterium]
MTFDRTWVLAIAWLPLAWILFEWRRTARKLGLVLKAACFMAILLALAEPRMILQETKVALAVLVDTSASSSAADLQRASQLAQTMSGARGRHWMKVVPFARSTRDLTSNEQQGNLKLTSTTGEAGRATDLEAAVREAIASLPSGMVPRVALISDGRENRGSIARAAWQAQQLGIPIDTFALAGHPEPALRLESVSLPSIAFTGEQFPIDVTVSSPSAGPAQVELSAEGKPLGQTQVNLSRGENPLRLHASLNTPGALDISVSIRAASLGEVHFDQAVTLRKPRVLYISQDPADQDWHLSATLAAAQFDVTRVKDPGDVHLNDYQLAIFNNWDLEAIPPAGKQAIEKYVQQGGGLLVIGGERNLYKEDKKVEDALDRTLPAKLAPPRSPEGTAVVLIIDKSSSMEGRKMELARVAAIGVVENLRPIDQVGVLIFDNSFEWAVPIRRAEDKATIKRLISGITPDGGTQIAPALTEAYRRIRPVMATYKHIVLLTDGISEEGDSLGLAKEAEAQKITISTVGLGQDVNRGYLERVALSAGGKSYFLTEPQGLEQLLLRDVLEHTGSTTVERPLNAEVLKHAEILNDVGMETAPALKGYVRFISKPTAETILQLDRHDPLLARWQYGLGRSAVFTSDAKARWAADWVTWKGYDKFWTNLCRDLLPRAQGGEASIEYDSANGDLVTEYRLGRGVPEPEQIPDIYAFGPDGFQQPVPVKKIAAGTFRGRLPIGQRQGLFRVRPVQESRAFPEAGLYRPEAELADYGSNEALLKQVAEFTGGRFQPDPASVYSGGGRSIASSLQLWPGLLGLAVLLSLAELVMRKWKGVIARE